MARKSSSDHHHHKHSKHKHRHKHGSHKHKKKKHKKSGSSDRERERRRESQTPEVRVDERELQTALESLEESLIEQCVRSCSSADEEASDAPPPAFPLNPAPESLKGNEGEPLNPASEHREQINAGLKLLPDTQSSGRDDSEAIVGEERVAGDLAVPPLQTEAGEVNCVDALSTMVRDSVLESERESSTTAQPVDRTEVGGREVGGREVGGREVGGREVGGRDVGEREGDDQGGGEGDESDGGRGKVRELSGYDSGSSVHNNLQLRVNSQNTTDENQVNIPALPNSHASTESTTSAAEVDKQRDQSQKKTILDDSTALPEALSHDPGDVGSDERGGGGGGVGEEEERGTKKNRRHSGGGSEHRRKRHRDSSGKRSSRRDGSPSHSPLRKRSRSPSRSRRSSPHSRRRHRSRSKSRSHSRSRSPYRSRNKRHRSRSPYHSSSQGMSRRTGRGSPYHSRQSQHRGRESYGRSPRHRQSRSRSRNRSPQGSRRRGRRRRSYSSGSHSRSRSQEKKEEEKKEEKEEEGGRGLVLVGDAQVKAVVREMAAKVKQVHIGRFTALCKDLQKRQEWEDQGEQGGQGEVFDPQPAVRDPFQLSQRPPSQSHVWKTSAQVVAEGNALQLVRPLTEQFPVSCGVDHQQQQNTSGSTDQAHDISVFSGAKSVVPLGELAQRRLEASQRLQQNPLDQEAQQMLAFVESQASDWVAPGQYTGRKKLTALTAEDHKAGVQAWVKKNMFKGLAPVLSGFGIKMMKKMGWSEGQPLGRMGKGLTEPIPMTIKVDRAGLSTVEDKSQPFVPVSALKAVPATGKSAHLVQGKHPVSALQEICAKKHWDPPHYELVSSSGPSHQMNFLFQVTLPCGSFRPVVSSANKKLAKAQAALACLQGLALAEK